MRPSRRLSRGRRRFPRGDHGATRDLRDLCRPPPTDCAGARSFGAAALIGARRPAGHFWVGLQIVQAIGYKRLLQIFAIAGVAFALASRPRSEGGAAARRARRRRSRPLDVLTPGFAGGYAHFWFPRGTRPEQRPEGRSRMGRHQNFVDLPLVKIGIHPTLSHWSENEGAPREARLATR